MLKMMKLLKICKKKLRKKIRRKIKKKRRNKKLKTLNNPFQKGKMMKLILLKKNSMLRIITSLLKKL